MHDLPVNVPRGIEVPLSAVFPWGEDRPTVEEGGPVLERPSVEVLTHDPGLVALPLQLVLDGVRLRDHLPGCVSVVVHPVLWA